jgi:ABC-type ATPase involved in cell division
MNRVLLLIAVCGSLVACGTTRYGIMNVAPEYAASEDMAMQAIQTARSPEESGCVIELLQMSQPKQTSPNTYEQVATVKVCGKQQRYAIQRSLVKENQVLVAAKRI